MLPVILMFIQFFLTNANPIDIGKECTISIEYKSGDLKEPQPLILQRNASKPTILYPTNRKGILRIPAGQSIHLACPGRGNLLKNVGSAEATAICMENKMFRIEENVVEFSTLVCKYLPRHESRRVNSTVCLQKYKPIEIGFPLKGYFLPVLEICRDDKTFVTHYSKFKLTKAIGSFQTPYPRPSMWITGTHFPNLDVHYLYTFNSQLNMFARILNSTKLVDKYLNRNRQSITRGHLTAKSDLVYGSLQSATFWYLNAAPQWMTFNSGNWQTLENSVQRYADRNQRDLDVYTGVHGQMTLPNARGTPTPMYLYAEGRRRALPVPKFYWKVVYHPETKLGTAFVGVNDPFLVSNTTDIFLCSDISYQINWIKWSPNKTKGVSYACTIDDLRRKVPAVPALNVTGMLK